MLKELILKIYRKLKRIAAERIFKQPKVDPKAYSAIQGKEYFVPCQIEAYFFVLNNYVNENMTILDVGFGLGYGLNILSIKTKEISGVDVDEKVYNYCKKMFLGKNPKLAKLDLYDGYNLRYKDENFDLITCIEVLEHVEDYDRLIKEMLRVAKKGLFISTPNRRPENTNRDGTPKNYWHLREWRFDELRRIFEKYGKVEWYFLNGDWDGPFDISRNEKKNTLSLFAYIKKRDYNSISN